MKRALTDSCSWHMDKIVDGCLFDGKYDESNPLVLLPKKKNKSKKVAVVEAPKILSRAKRKEFQKQISRKHKKLTVCCLFLI